MPEHDLFGLPMVIILVLMFIVIFISLLLIMTPKVEGGSWINVLVTDVLNFVWPIR
jgi:hypothetical protein